VANREIGAVGSGLEPNILSQGSATAMTQYDFAMERVTLAILRVTDALTANDPLAIAQECAHARQDYEYFRRLYLKLQLQAAERDSLLAQMGLLGSQLNHCKAFLRRPIAVEG
jgi:hypothetical protein